jgi:hypothetical protein
MEAPQNSKIRITIYDLTIPFVGIYQEECKSAYNTDTCILMFVTALFTIITLLNQSRYPSTEEWIRKMWYIYTAEYYFPIKSNEII